MDSFITIFANYGMLAHEGQAVWSITPASSDEAADSECVICKLPDGYSAAKNDLGEPLVIDSEGMVNVLAEILPKPTALGEDPYLMFATADSWKRVPLAVIKRAPWTPVMS